MKRKLHIKESWTDREMSQLDDIDNIMYGYVDDSRFGTHVVDTDEHGTYYVNYEGVTVPIMFDLSSPDYFVFTINNGTDASHQYKHRNVSDLKDNAIGIISAITEYIEDNYIDDNEYTKSKRVMKSKNHIKESKLIKESIEDFNGYEFDPESSWTSIWNDVIQPIIDDEFNYNPGIESNIEDDIEAKITMFEDEFGYYPNVKLACDKFWRG